MKARMRSSVSVVMRPPLRSRLASLPSLTARRPKVDSATPVRRQKSAISRRMASFMPCLVGTVIARRPKADEAIQEQQPRRGWLGDRFASLAMTPTGRAGVNHKIAHWRVGSRVGEGGKACAMAAFFPQLRAEFKR